MFGDVIIALNSLIYAEPTLSAKWTTMKDLLDILGFSKCPLLECLLYSFCAQF